MSKAFAVGGLFLLLLLVSIVSLESGLTAKVLVASEEVVQTPAPTEITGTDVWSVLRNFFTTVGDVVIYIVNVVGSVAQLVTASNDVPAWLAFITVTLTFVGGLFIFLLIRGN